MNPTSSRWSKILAVPLAATLVLAACGSGDESGDGGSSGTVDVSGSSTVAPISTRVAELWEASGEDATVNVDGPGTGDGFQLFCEGETDVSNASRTIKGEELESCEANGIEYIELKVAFDGIAVMTSPANEAIECLSFADMYALVGPESEGFDQWSDGQDLAADLGSDTELPDAPLDIFGPGEESGTYDSFVELVIEPIGEERAEAGDIAEDDAAQTRADYSSSADDNVIIQGIQGSDTSFGWVGFAFAEEAADTVKELEVAAEPNGDCVAPTPETIADGSYPVSRPLYIYVNAEKADSNETLADYIDYYLSDDGIAAVSEVGYVELPADELEQVRATWNDRTTGTTGT